MASAYGIIHQYGEPQSTFDADLALQALSHKQGKFDANLLKIEQTLNQWGLQASQMKNGEAREYLYQKVSNLTNNIQNLSGADLSQRGVTQGIIGHINQALDPTVMYHMAAGKQIEQFQANIQQIREDNPEKLSDLNLQDAMQRSGYNEYVNGGLDAKLGPLSYVPYVDKVMEVNKKIKLLKETNKKESFEIDLGNGQTKTVTVEDMTPAQWYEVFPSLITPDIQAQIEVEGRARMGWSDDAARNYLSGIRDTAVEEKKKKLENYKVELKGQISEGERKRLTDEKTLLEKQITELETRTFENKNATNVGAMLVREEFRSRVSQRVGAEPSVSLQGKQNTATDRTKAALLGGSSALITTPLPQENQEVLTRESFAEREVASDQALTNSISTAYSALPSDIKTVVDEKVKGIMNPESVNYDPNRTVEDARYEAMISSVPMASTDSYAYVDAMKRAKDVNDNYYKAVVETSNETTKGTWNEASDGVYDALFNETHNIELFDRDGQSVTTDKYFSDRGIRTKEDFKNFLNSPASDDFKAQYYAEGVIKSRFVGRNTPSYGLTQMEGGVMTVLTPNLLKSFNRVTTTLGEDVDVTDVFTVTDGGGNRLSEAEVVAAIKEGSTGVFNMQLNTRGKTDSETYKYLQNAVGASQTRTGNIFSRDKTLHDDAYIGSLFDTKEYDKKYIDRLKINSINIAGLNAITFTDVPTTNKEAQENPYWDGIQAFASDIGNSQRAQFDYGQPIVFRRGEGGTIIATQFESNSKADWENQTIFTAGGDKVAVGSEQAFAKYNPKLYNQIMQKETEGELVFGLGETKYSKIRSFPETTIQSKKAALNYLGPTMATLAVRDEAVQAVKTELPEIFQSEAAAGYTVLLNRAFDNTDQFRTGYVENQDGSKYISVEGNIGSPTEPEWKLISEVDVSNNTAETVQRILNTANQAYLTIGLTNLLREVANRGTREEIENYDKFNNLKATLKIR